VKKLGLRPTRENYLAIDRWDNTDPLTAEEEMELPPRFRRQPSRPAEIVKEKNPEITVTYTRRVLTPEEQAAHDWKMENWLRCRCECDDLFDMCLNCITHRQLNLVQ
jgi:hypothetical protein